MPPLFNPRKMRGASAGAAGTSGYVPAPAAGQQDFQIFGDGTWRQGPMAYKGTLAGASVPASSTAAGDVYVIISAGTSQSITWAIGDQALWNGSAWAKLSPGVTPVALGGTAGTTAATARTNLSVPSVIETNDLVLSRPPIRGVQFHAGISGTRLVATTRQTIGTASFTLWFRVTLPNAAGNFGIGGLSSSATTIAAANGFGIRITSGGALRVTLFGATTSDFRYAEVAAFTTSYLDKTVDLQVARDAIAGTLTIYVNGVAASVAETTGGTPPAWTATVDGTYFLAGLHDASQIWPRRMYRATLLNFVPTAAEAVDFVAHGLPAFYKTGSNTALIDGSTLNGGFETAGSPHGSWTKTEAGTSTVTDEGTIVHGGAHASKWTIDGTNGYASLTSAAVLVVGAAYEVNFWARSDSGTPTLTMPTWQPSPTDSANLPQVTLSSTYALKTMVFLAGVTTMEIKRDTATGRILYLDDVTLIRRGALVDMALDCGLGATIPDRSGNHIMAAASGGVAHVGETQAGEITYTATFLHSDISATAATTAFFSLPDNCGAIEFEQDREIAFDGGVTLDIGISGTGAKYASAAVLSTTGKLLTASLSTMSESATANTTVYLKKSGATTVGKTTIRAICRIRGNKS